MHNKFFQGTYKLAFPRLLVKVQLS